MKNETIVNKDSVIYTDGHGVKITENKFYADEHTYSMEGITSVQLKKRPASIAFSMFLFFIGVICLVMGFLEMFDFWRFENNGAIYRIDANLFLEITGGVMILLGVISYAIKKDRYSVLIGTAEGLREPVISKSREYTAYIVSVLEQIFTRRSAGKIKGMAH